MTNRDPNDPGASRPRSEPEIIPPGDTRRIYMARPGPFTIILALAVLALIALVMLIVLLSVAVIWIPVVIALIAAFMLSIYWRRFRLWLARR
jgi:hypothetical protein